ncbi:hypothetical protein [Nostoc flagelliforme]|uniref:hypothetical protein n=1 Tax=Nostoc flagelliforme TaxID=1306274 RepID=UPI001F555214|nr:hypothetical protein [Nostoc flagelliforme]
MTIGFPQEILCTYLKSILSSTFTPSKNHAFSVIIKANTEGLCVLLNAIVTAIAYQENNGTAEVFDGDAEVYEVVVRLVNTHDGLAPVPYQIEKQ